MCEDLQLCSSVPVLFIHPLFVASSFKNSQKHSVWGLIDQWGRLYVRLISRTSEKGELMHLQCYFIPPQRSCTTSLQMNILLEWKCRYVCVFDCSVQLLDVKWNAPKWLSCVYVCCYLWRGKLLSKQGWKYSDGSLQKIKNGDKCCVEHAVVVIYCTQLFIGVISIIMRPNSMYWEDVYPYCILCIWWLNTN